MAQQRDAGSSPRLVLHQHARAAHARSDPASPRPCHEGPRATSPLSHTCCASKRSRTRVFPGPSVQRWPRKTRTRDRRGWRANGRECRPTGGNFDRRSRIQRQNHDPSASCRRTSDSHVMVARLALGAHSTIRPTNSAEPALASRHSTMHQRHQRGHRTHRRSSTPLQMITKEMYFSVLPFSFSSFPFFSFLFLFFSFLSLLFFFSFLYSVACLCATEHSWTYEAELHRKNTRSRA